MTVFRRMFGLDGTTERPLKVDSAGRMKISQGQPDAVMGNLTALNQTVVLGMDGFSSFTIQLSGTFVATVTIEQSFDDGVTWVAGTGTRSDVVSAAYASVTTPSVTVGYAPGATHIRARVSAFTSGTVVTRAIASTAAVTPIVPTHGVTGTVTATMPVPTTTSYELAATTNLTLVSGTGTTLTEITLFNASAAPIYLKIYNKTTAPVVASDTPILTIPVAAGATLLHAFGSGGKRMTAGMAFAVTLNAVKTDATAIPAGSQLSLSRV